MKILTWNVNSIRSRLPNVLEYIKRTQPDLLLLQELKCTNDQFPYMELEELGYNIATHGQKTYNGVAILSRHPLEDIRRGFPDDTAESDARYIEAVVTLPHTALRVASVYVPNGQSAESEKFTYKLRFLERLREHAQTLLRYEEIFVIGGDYNVAPTPLDVYAPKELEGSICFHAEERKRFRSLVNIGLTDAYRTLHPNHSEYSWWDYRGGGFEHNKGMRIDHLLLSPEAAERLTHAGIDAKERSLEKASDHAPVWCHLNLT